jgi:hypothetical protein
MKWKSHPHYRCNPLHMDENVEILNSKTSLKISNYFNAHVLFISVQHKLLPYQITLLNWYPRIVMFCLFPKIVLSLCIQSSFQRVKPITTFCINEVQWVYYAHYCQCSIDPLFLFNHDDANGCHYYCNYCCYWFKLGTICKEHFESPSIRQLVGLLLKVCTLLSGSNYNNNFWYKTNCNKCHESQWSCFVLRLFLYLVTTILLI